MENDVLISTGYALTSLKPLCLDAQLKEREKQYGKNILKVKKLKFCELGNLLMHAKSC